MNSEGIIVKYFRRYEVDAVKSFYSHTTYRNGASVKREDEIVVAFEGDKMVGLFRLCAENGVCVLRGFNVLIEYQRKGIGTLMLMKFEGQLKDRQCYLICKKGLNRLYAKAGFEICGDNTPDFLIARKAGYSNEELNILVRNRS